MISSNANTMQMAMHSLALVSMFITKWVTPALIVQK